LLAQLLLLFPGKMKTVMELLRPARSVKNSETAPAPVAEEPRDADRRHFERRNIYLPLTFTAQAPGNRRISGCGTTVNISAGGAFFLSRERKIETGMRMEMVFSPESALIHDRKVVMTATVLGVYRFAGADENPTGDWGIAVKFGEIWEFDWPEEASRVCGMP